MYKKAIKPFLFLFDPEKVHNAFVWFGETLGSFALGRIVVDLFYGYRGADISKVVDGIYYRTPVVLAAGFDYNARLTEILPSLSFGGEEIGSITALPCAGNPSPQLRRLPHTKSILVNKGLRNDGADAIIKRLQAKEKMKDFVLGVSIARTNDPSASTVEAGIADYALGLEKMINAGVGDYYTINISCPNSFGGEAFTTPELLEKLFARLDAVSRAKPLYVKMPISISDETFRQLLAVLDRHEVSGVIIGNLQKDYAKIDAKDHMPKKYEGGLSGKPCEDRSNELIAFAKKEYQKRFTVIGCGGVFSYEDAKKKFDAGADLIQLITGMIYEGPALMKMICRGLALQKIQK